MGAEAEQLGLEDYQREIVRRATLTAVSSARTGDPDLFESACDAIRALARTGRVFDADDVRRELAGLSGPAVGSAFRALSASEEIHAVGLGVSSAPSRHGALLRRWCGSGSPP